jgi:arylsulfatase A-like enzyme
MRILYIDVDSLRPDHTGPYSYARAITPNLDRIAREAVVFERCYCSDSPCMPSRSSLTSMTFGIETGAIGHHVHDGTFRYGPGGFHDAQRPLFGRHLDRHGIKTASISCFADRHRAFHFLGNFRESIRPTLSTGNDEDAGDVNRAAFRWLREHAAEDNWFLHINYWEPHTDYVMPKEWADRAASLGPAPAWPDEAAIARHQEIFGPHSATDLHGNQGGPSSFPDTMPNQIRGRADFEKLINGYDGGIHYWDYHFGLLLAELERLGILDDTVIIVSADHGESFGENGSYAEHGLANEATHHIPLIVRWPGLTDRLPEARRRCDALLYHLDLGPSLCELLDLPLPPGWAGRSWAGALHGEAIESRERLFLSHGAHTYQRAVRSREWLYIRTLHPGCFRCEPEMLFHIASDPHLATNRIDRDPVIAEEMRRALDQWVHERSVGKFDPMVEALPLGPTLYADPQSYAAWLAQQGRPEAARELLGGVERAAAGAFYQRR